MSNNMSVGRQQIIFTYLPGKTFDYSKNNVIAQISHIIGNEVTDIGIDLVLRAIEDYISPWRDANRPALKRHVFQTEQRRFVLLNPLRAESVLFPKVFYCSNQACKKVFDYSQSDALPKSALCPACKNGQLTQFRWVQVHRCGSLQPLRPPFKCKKCNKSNWALDTRGHLRIRDFVWTCKECGNSLQVITFDCNECSWDDQIEGVRSPRKMDIEVHRANRTYYSHYLVLLNLPKKEVEVVLSLKEWPEIAAAALFEIPEMEGKRFSDILKEKSSKITPELIQDLRDSDVDEEVIKKLLKKRSSDPSTIARSVIEGTGVGHDIWESGGQELLETILPMQSSNSTTVMDKGLAQYGLSNLTLVTDFPIITATFGYSRVDYRPNYCRINPFPPDRNHDNRYPIIIDKIQADAVMIQLSPGNVLDWLKKNGFSPKLPNGKSTQLSEKGYFVELFEGINCRNVITQQNAEARMVFGLLHTYSHILIRQAALLSGLDVTSITEYILPRTLTFALFGNHRFSSTIGALISLFEDSRDEWLNNVRASYRCVYDPICSNQGGSCHACTHLAETSCRFFNQNLSRSFLFGGYDQVLQTDIQHGYIDL